MPSFLCGQAGYVGWCRRNADSRELFGGTVPLEGSRSVQGEERPRVLLKCLPSPDHTCLHLLYLKNAGRNQECGTGPQLDPQPLGT